MGKNQNPNEALHSKIWATLHKTKFYRLETVQLASTDTVLKHNFVYGRVNIMKEMGFGGPSPATDKYLSNKEKARHKAFKKTEATLA